MSDCGRIATSLLLEYDPAYDTVLRAVEGVLGAYVAIDDRRGGSIEAAFGLVNSERVRCTLTRVGDANTAVRIEALLSGRCDGARTFACRRRDGRPSRRRRRRLTLSRIPCKGAALGNLDRTVGLLKVLHDCKQRAANGQARNR